MNADELKKTDEIVRALRDYASDCDGDEACFQCTFAWICDELDNNAPKIIANLIDSLTAQLAESQRREKAAVADFEILKGCKIKSDCCRACRVCKKSVVNKGSCYHGKCEGFEYRDPLETEKGETE